MNNGSGDSKQQESQKNFIRFCNLTVSKKFSIFFYREVLQKNLTQVLHLLLMYFFVCYFGGGRCTFILWSKFLKN